MGVIPELPNFKPQVLIASRPLDKKAPYAEGGCIYLPTGGANSVKLWLGPHRNLLEVMALATDIPLSVLKLYTTLFQFRIALGVASVVEDIDRAKTDWADYWQTRTSQS